MSAKARASADWDIGRFVIYHDGELVGRVNLVSGINDALEAMKVVDAIPRIPNIGVSGLDEQGATWFLAWSATLGEKRHVTIRSNADGGRWIRFNGAFIVHEHESFVTDHISNVLSIDTVEVTTGPS